VIFRPDFRYSQLIILKSVISFIFCNAVFITNQLKIITSSVFLIFNIKISS
jgi:glucan phosphoethanolaminetransferase (alkaline phosphatase superfamily)